MKACLVLIVLLGSGMHGLPRDIDSINVRVRLADLDAPQTQKPTYTLTCTPGSSLEIHAERHIMRLAGNQITIRVEPDHFVLRGSGAQCCRCTAQRITIKTSDSQFALASHAGDRTYEGILTITRRPHAAPLIVNTLPLDKYLYAVLPSEIFQSWPAEMHKVQAIISRTYALYHVEKARSRGKAYDLSNTNSHQSYRGTHAYHHIRDAISATKNTIVLFDKKPILAMFDACCGGVTPAKIASPLTTHSYLARAHQCTFCKGCSLFSWHKKINLTTLATNLAQEKSIAQHIAKRGAIRALEVSAADAAGLASRIALIHSSERTDIPIKFLMRHAGIPLWSNCLAFEQTADENISVVNGHGLGHCFGLCQYGAYALVKQGWLARHILAYYYPGTSLSTTSLVNDSHARV